MWLVCHASKSLRNAITTWIFKPWPHRHRDMATGETYLEMLVLDWTEWVAWDCLNYFTANVAYLLHFLGWHLMLVSFSIFSPFGTLHSPNYHREYPTASHNLYVLLSLATGSRCDPTFWESPIKVTISMSMDVHLLLRIFIFTFFSSCVTLPPSVQLGV